MLLRPLVAHRCGGREARRVVDDGTAAQCRALQHHETEIARREQSPRIVQPREPVALVLREIGFVVITTFFENHDVLASSGQLGRHDGAAGARPDDHDIARERRVARDRERPDRFRGWRRRTEWTRIADRPGRAGRRVVRHGDEPLQRLKCLAARRQRAGRPAAEIPLPLCRRHRAERAENTGDEQVHHTALEQPEQQLELRAVGRAGQHGDMAGDPRRQVRLVRAAAHQRGGDGPEGGQRAGREGQRSCTNVSLNPSGSEIMNTRSPHGMSFGS